MSAPSGPDWSQLAKAIGAIAITLLILAVVGGIAQGLYR